MSFDFETLSAEEIDSLLLDLAKGRLSQDKATQVKTAVSKSPKLAEELEYYIGLERAWDADAFEDTTPGEMGWARLSREIDKETAIQAPLGFNNNMWQYAAMFLGFVVIAQFSAPFIQSNIQDDVRYIPATETVDRFSAQITFAPQASEEDIREVLLKTKANIIAGPSSLGIYQISFTDAEMRETGLAQLTDADKVVESATAQ